jgi:tetratricopeptide (TPR) repeat protein
MAIGFADHIDGYVAVDAIVVRREHDAHPTPPSDPSSVRRCGEKRGEAVIELRLFREIVHQRHETCVAAQIRKQRVAGELCERRVAVSSGGLEPVDRIGSFPGYGVCACDRILRMMVMTERASILFGSSDIIREQPLVAHDAQRWDEARTFYEQALETFGDLRDSRRAASSLADLGTVARERGDVDRAAECYRQALALFVKLRHRRGVARVLELLAMLAVARGAFARTLTLSSAASRFRQMVGAQARAANQAQLTVAVQAAKQRLSAAAAEHAVERGATMTLTEAVQYAESEE